MIEGDKYCYPYNVVFWIEGDATDIVNMYNENNYGSIKKTGKNAKIIIENCFSGYKCPVRLVR